MSRFKEATRSKAKLRMALDGPSGSGKTWTALGFATALARFVNPANPRVAVIDTERGSASLYVGIKETPDSEPWQFAVTELWNFSPSEYAQAIEEAGAEKFDVIVIDSLSHAWEGRDGALDLVDKNGKGSGWKDVTPMHRRMVDAILQSPAHVLVTMRSKVEYVYEKDEKGKVVPKKVGMAPIQKPGMEYEFTIYGSMDWSHIMTITKSRCPAAADAIVVKPSGQWILPVAQWLMTGADVDVQAVARRSRLGDDQLTEITRLMAAGAVAPEKLASRLVKYSTQDPATISPEQATDLIGWLTAQAAANAKRAKAVEAVAAAGGANGANGANSTNSTSEAPPQKPLATDSQLANIKTLRDQLIDAGRLDAEGWRAVLAKRSVTTARDLSPEQADELVKNLRKAVDLLEAEGKEAKETEGIPAEGSSEDAPAKK